jgi:hypothetical protein
VAACAILYPEMIVLIVPIRWAAWILVALYVLGLAVNRDLADAAHLGPMAAAAAWLLLVPTVLRRWPRRQAGAWRWQRKLARRRKQEEKVDRILNKVRLRGISSLSWRQRRQLRQATRRQQREDRGP